jgi:hypothetical protein
VVDTGLRSFALLVMKVVGCLLKERKRLLFGRRRVAV